jgi:Fe2+ or Zn2+ uptake regulation protein
MKSTRQTIQKNLVKEAVLSSCDHPTAEQVFETIVATHPSVSKATVYRNLNLLVEDGLVRRVQIPGGADRFDKTTSDHYHIQCRNCKCVDDVVVDGDLDILGSITDAKGFEVSSFDLVFSGLCPDCQEKKAAEKQ